MLKYLDEIVDNLDELSKMADYAHFKRALILDADGDYFDLIQNIKGRINEFDKLKPIINIELEAETELKGMLHQSLSIVFMDKYIASHPSKWAENEMILRRLYEEANSLLAKSPGSEILDKDRRTATVKDLAINDFHNFLQKVGFLSLADYSYGGGENSSPTRENKYYLSRKFVGNIPEKLFFLGQLEEQLISDIEKLYQIVMNCCNVYEILQNVPAISFAQVRQYPLSYANRINSWGIDAKNAVSELAPVYKKLVDSHPAEALKREDVEKYLTYVDEAIGRLTNNAHNLLARIFQDALKDLNLQIMVLNDSQNLFPPITHELEQLRIQLIEHKVRHQILTSQDFSKQIMFCLQLPEGMQTYKFNEDGKRRIWQVDENFLYSDSSNIKTIIGRLVYDMKLI